MAIIPRFIDLVLHFDKYLTTIVSSAGTLSYVVLFLIIFLETGFVIAPLLPGDSLLFATGAIASLGTLNIFLLFVLLSIAAILGDSVNYAIGKYTGPKIFQSEHSRWFNKAHLENAHTFYEKYGAKTIILARFLPIIRTFAPFVAGIGHMNYWKFFTYNVIGGVAWVGIFLSAGYFFGNIPTVKENFSLVILVIIIFSLLPAVVEYLKHRKVQKDSHNHTINKE